jgi:Fur family transcriptional regulator, peroxide stress response regulator
MIINKMVDPELRYLAMLAKIKQRSGRITSHRMALLRLIAASEGHPSAGQLYERLRIQFPTVSPATIYKTLALLKEEGEVLEIDLRSDSRYDGNKPYPHPHLICTRCNRIIDGDDMLTLQNIDQQIEAKYGFHVLRQQMVFYGICPECLLMAG